MSTRIEHLRALTSVCRRLGGRLAIVEQLEFDAVFDPRVDHACGGEERSEAPFTDAHGLWWRKKIIYAVRGRESVNGIIHEMGHVFASPHHPDCACRECHEWSWFGWEITLARQIDAVRTWSYHNAEYVIDDDGTAWAKLSPRKRRLVVADRLACARKNGYVGAEGELRSLR